MCHHMHSAYLLTVRAHFCHQSKLESKSRSSRHRSRKIDGLKVTACKVGNYTIVKAMRLGGRGGRTLGVSNLGEERVGLGGRGRLEHQLKHLSLHDGQNTETLRTIILYKRVCIRQTTHPSSRRQTRFSKRTSTKMSL